MSTYDVAVVGRGAIGLATALAFGRAGRRVALVAPLPGTLERAAASIAAPVAAPGGTTLAATATASSESPLFGQAADWDQRVYALSPASRTLLMELGVWQLLEPARVAPVHDMRIFHQASGGGGGPRRPPEVHLDAYQGRVEALAWILENRQLQAALERAIAVTLPRERLEHVHSEVEGLTLPAVGQEGGLAWLSLAGGGKLAARLVVAADGTGSRLRDLAGIEHVVRDYDQTAIVANFESSLPHRDCAWQWFGDFGVVALLPLPSDDLGHGRGRVSLVWSAPGADAARALREDGAWLAAQVEAMADGMLGTLRLITPAAAYPLRAVRCRQVIKPGFVLIGDAAHAIHPMAGQGMNLGFGDVRGLIEHVIGAGPPAYPTHAAYPTLPAQPMRAPDWFDLRRYERSRREPVAVMQLALDGLHQAFGDLPAPLVGLRDIGWSIVARSAWLRRRMIAHAVS